jgi:DNA-directed RNA polymerase specialized sigma24 family protein
MQVIAVGAVEALSSTTKRTHRLFRTAQAVAQDLSVCARPTPSYRTARPLQPDEVEKLVEAKQAGATVRELAQQFGVCRTTVFKHLHARGLRTRSLDPELLAEATSLYGDGWSTARIGKQLDIPTETLRTALKVSGVAMRRPGRPRKASGTPAQRR